jgi:hypothetical protein
LGLDRTVARLTLPRLPAVHLEDGSRRGASTRGTRERSQV